MNNGTSDECPNFEQFIFVEVLLLQVPGWLPVNAGWLLLVAGWLLLVAGSCWRLLVVVGVVVLDGYW